MENKNINIKKTPFIIKNYYLIGLIFSILFIIMFINFIIFHFIISKNSLFIAVMTNTCIPSCLIFVIGFFLKNELILAISSVFIFRYGILGFFDFVSYKYFDYISVNITKFLPFLIFIQIQHLIMLLSVIFVIFSLIYKNKIKKMFYGFLIGIIFLTPFMIFQHNWISKNPDILFKVFLGE